MNVPKNETEAFKWSRKAAEQGHAPSQFSLGLMYMLGQGTQKDEAEGLAWIRKAADQGMRLPPRP